MEHSSYNAGLVLMSYAMSVFGSFVALMLAAQVNDLQRTMDRIWLIGASIALGGGGIWSMHFIAMLAYDSGMTVAYDLPLTLGSLLVGVLFTGIGFFVACASSARNLSVLTLAGALMGSGVAAMHYMGMAGMRMPADAHYDTSIVALSVVIAIVASCVALWLAFNLTKTWQKLAAAFVMGAAVCGMHYTAMLGTSFAANHANVDYFGGAILGQELASTVVMATVSVLALGVAMAFGKEISEGAAAQ
jgi:NO-binding membrane sensor protein with MHYT domain